MYRQLLEKSPLLALPLLSLFLFLVCFVAIVIRTYARRSDAYAQTAGAVTDESLATLSRDGKTAAEGQAIFASTCAACHSASGGGGIGPNLTDEFWLHGGKPTQVYDTIKEGFTAKGMPAWGGTLGEE